MLDLNFSLKPEGLVRVARAAKPHRMTWLAIDIHEPEAPATVRRAVNVPVASLESIYGRRAYRAYRAFLERYAVAVAIADVPWNGLLESMKIANLASSYEMIVKKYPNLDLFCLSVVNDPDLIREIQSLGVRFLRKGETPLRTILNMIRSRLTGIAYSSESENERPKWD